MLNWKNGSEQVVYLNIDELSTSKIIIFQSSPVTESCTPRARKTATITRFDTDFIIGSYIFVLNDTNTIFKNFFDNTQDHRLFNYSALYLLYRVRADYLFVVVMVRIYITYRSSTGTESVRSWPIRSISRSTIP